MLLMSQRLRSWIRDLCKGFAGNCSDIETSNVFSSVERRQGSYWKVQRGNLCERSGIWVKHQRNKKIELEKTGWDYHNLHVADEKVR